MLRFRLDNHLSPTVARALRDRGHDVVALQEAPRSVRELSDELLLDQAAHEERVFVTYNVRDFVHLHRSYLAAGRSHSGIAVISYRTIRQDDIGGQIRALEAILVRHRDSSNLRDQLIWVEAVDPRPQN